MARIFPSTVDSDADWNNSDAERKLYEALRDYTADRWLAFWSRPWARPGVEGESDFTVVHPELGGLVIEVKGGRIRYQAAQRQWFSTDRNGCRHRIKDPFIQVRKNRHALLETIRSAPEWAGERIPLYGAVAFTDCLQPSGQLPPEWCAEQVLDIRDITPENLEPALRRAIEYGRGDRSDTPQDAQRLASFLVRLWTQTVEGLLGFVYRLREESDRLDRLTTEQADLVMGLFGRKRRLALCGPAGCGKTFLAMEKARSLAKESQRVLVVCFNKALAQHLRQAVVTRAPLEVLHFHGLCEVVCREAGVALPDPTEDPERVFGIEWPDRLCAAFEATPALRYDGILVDEGQDFQPHWFIALEAGLKDPTESTFYVFYDDNQRLYAHAERDIPIDVEDTFRLTKVVRNTQRIFDLCRRFYQGPGGVSAIGPPGCSVLRRPYDTTDELRGCLRDTLADLLSEGVEARDLAVLTPHALSKSRLMNPEPVGLPHGFRLTDRPEHPNDILVSTVHSFKGLERPFIVLAELDRHAGTWDWYEQVCYVGFSRAKVGLAVIYERGVLDGVFEV